MVPRTVLGKLTGWRARPREVKWQKQAWPGQRIRSDAPDTQGDEMAPFLFPRWERNRV